MDLLFAAMDVLNVGTQVRIFAIELMLIRLIHKRGNSTDGLGACQDSSGNRVP